MRSKKAQVTIFIIVGMVLLILVLGGFYLKAKLTGSSSFFSSNQDPVQLYVQQCLSTVTKQGLQLMGLQGGYIYVDKYSPQTAKLDPENSPLLSQSSAGLYLPYWYYQDKNSLFDKSEMPELMKTSDFDDSMQDQLERYIAQKLPECTNKFIALKKQNLVVVEKNLGNANLKLPLVQVKVSFNDKETTVVANYPLEILQKDATQSLDEFTIAVPVGMTRVYKLAKEIKDYESSTFFLEKNTQNLIHLYSGFGDHELPPTYDFKLDQCVNAHFWFYPTVEESFKAMLRNNVPFYRIINTDTPQYKITKEVNPDTDTRSMQQGILLSLAHETSTEKYNNMHVDFSYENDFPLTLDLGSKGILEPNNHEINLLFLDICMMEYRFAYSFSYPVLVSVLDKNSNIDNQAYFFQFPMQVIVKDNLARVRLSDIVALPTVNSNQLNDCAEENRISGDSTIRVVDQNKKPVPDALVYFQCGPSFVDNFAGNGSYLGKSAFAQKCFIGKTGSNVIGSDGKTTAGKLTAKFPACTGGSIVSVKADGYVEKADKLQDIKNGKGFQATVELQKTKKVALAVKKYFVAPPTFGIISGTSQTGIMLDDAGNVAQCNLYGSATGLNKNEKAIVRFKQLDSESGVLLPPPFVVYDPEKESSLMLAPGDYEVDVTLLRNEAYPGELVIQKNSESRHVPGALFTPGKTVYYPDKDVKLPSVFTGGNLFNITITDKDLENNKLTLYAIDEAAPKIIEQVSVGMVHRERCYELNKEQLGARFETQ